MDIYEGETCRQYFSGEDGSLQYVDIRITAYGRENTCDLALTLTDETTDEVLAIVFADQEKMRDGEMYRFHFSDVELDQAHNYSVALSSEDGTEGNCFAVGIAPDPDPTDDRYSSIDGIEDTMNFCMAVQVANK